MVLMVDGSTLKLDNSCESVHIVNSSGSCDLGAEAMASDRGVRDLVLVHEANDVLAHLVHVVGLMMIRRALITVVKAPNVANVAHLVIFAVEELCEVLGWLGQLWQPDHGWQVSLSAGQVLASQLHCLGVSLQVSL